MSSQKLAKKIGGSIENTSILRKFTVLFLMTSFIPFLLLIEFYYQVWRYDKITITETEFNSALIFITVGVLIGYFALRSLMIKIISLSDANKKALESVLDAEKLHEIGSEKNEIAVLARTFAEITSRLEDNVKSLELAKKTLHSIMGKIGDGIANMQNIDTFLELIVETVTSAINGKVGVLMLINNKKNELKIKSVYGVNYETDAPIAIKIDRGTTIHKVIESRKPLIMPRVGSDISKHKKHSFLFEPPLICTPLVYNEDVHGVMTISGCKDKNNFEEDESMLIYNLGLQIAVAIENSKLSEDIETTYFETISALALAVDAKDKYSRGHLDRVAKYTVMIGNKLGLEEEDIITLRDAARLHDLGKIGIPDEVLGKPAPLNDQEWELMREHPEIGESIIKPIRSLKHLCDIIRHHHEKLDGSGYPDGLQGDEITPLVRITTVADIYDALTTDRPYRDKMSRDRALKELRNMGAKLDQDIVEAFAEALEEQ